MWASLRMIVILTLVGIGPLVAEERMPAGSIAAAASAGNEQETRVVAQSASCASRCQQQHDSCRVRTKGSPNCDAARQRCLQNCLDSKGR
jgi:hypothetical protein